jgi:hypothetical protein
MTRRCAPSSSAELERRFDASVGEVLAVIDALGVDAEQHLHTVTGAFGYLGSGYSGVEPERHARTVSAPIRKRRELGNYFGADQIEISSIVLVVPHYR